MCEVVQLAERVFEVDDVAARGGVVLVAAFEVRPVDVGGAERVGAEVVAAGDERGLGTDAVAPGGEVVGGFDDGGRRARRGRR